VLEFLTKTRVTPEVNQRAVDVLAKNGISIGANFIIGSPVETRADLQETVEFVKKNRDHFDRCSVGPLQPLPGTPIWGYAKQKGLVSDDMDFGVLGVTYDHFDWATFPYMGENMTRDEFMEGWTTMHHLAKEINYVGQARRLTVQRMIRDHEIAQLRSQLDQLQGSRLIKAANWVRKALGSAPAAV
jgi:radical SAM superfamily enzyme YgiQ (UPF0313 family)